MNEQSVAGREEQGYYQSETEKTLFDTNIGFVLLAALFETFRFNLHGLGWEQWAVQFGLLVAVILFYLKAIKFAILVSGFSFAVLLLGSWQTIANHTWLTIWIMVPLAVSILLKQRFELDNYARLTLAIVMLFAVIQKLVSGNYLDGSFLTYLGLHGSITEKVFTLPCLASSNANCFGIIFVSWAAVTWQFLVSIFLFSGSKAKAVILFEVAFLAIVAIATDELNFFILNIALLNLYYQFIDLSKYTFGILAILTLDYFTINQIWLSVNGYL